MSNAALGLSGKWMLGTAVLVAGGVAVAISTGILDRPVKENTEPLAAIPAPPDPAAAQSEVSEPRQEASTAAAASPVLTLEEEPAEVPAQPIAPKFDLVRAELDGLTLVSGTAGGPGTIAVISGTPKTGKILGEQEVGRDGSFALFLDLPLEPGDRPLVLVLRRSFEDKEVFSDDEVIISPPAATRSDADETVQQTPVIAPEAVPQPDDDAPDAPDVADLAAGETVPQAPTVLLNTADGIGVLNAAALPPSMIALDAISYTGRGDVQISGRGNDEAFVRVYLDNTPLTSAEVQPDGSWQVDLPDVDAGTYTLRIDQVTATGEVVSRVESPFKREDPQVLAEARDAAQDVAITAVTVQPGNTLWAIARDRYGDGLAYVSVFEANASLIRDPDLIYPGQIFTLPDTQGDDEQPQE